MKRLVTLLPVTLILVTGLCIAVPSTGLAAQPLPECFGVAFDPANPHYLLGTNGDDHLIGIGASEVIFGLAGDDVITGGGSDTITYMCRWYIHPMA